MSNHPFTSPLCGIVPPLVTPLRDRDTLDVPGLERLIERVLAGGVAGVFILGTTGEGPSLSYRLRRELIQSTGKLVRSRVPVLVGITDTSFMESLQMARYAADCGAQAVVVSAPYYFPASQADLGQYLEALVPEMPLPLFLYNMPSHTKLAFEPETIRRALQLERIVGVKDSSGDMNYFRHLVEIARGRPDWTVLIGPETLTGEAVLLGAHGGVNGGANLHPRLYVDLAHAAAAKDLGRTSMLQAQVERIAESLYTVGDPPSAVIRGIKCALSCLGICSDVVAEPFHSFAAAERQLIAQRVRELGLAAGK